MPFILLEFGRQQGLIAEHGVVDKVDTGNPVTFGDITVRLQVILTADEVPHEIAPVHEVNLVTEEEAEVLTKGRTIIRFLLSAVLVAYTTSFDIRPLFVSTHMTSLRRIHTREDHAELLHVLVGSLMTGNDIMVFLAFHFRCRSILRMTDFFYRDTHVSFHAQFYRCVVGLTVEKRPIAVLLTVEVVLEREDIIRAVLIHRCICIGADHEGCVRTITDQDDRYHQYGCVRPTPFTFAGVPDSPYQQSYGQHDSNRQTGIERTAETVDEQQFEPTEHGRIARDDTIEDDQEYRTRSEEGIEESFPRELVLTEVINESDRRDGQQVQQVDTDGETHEVRNRDQPTV